MLTDVAARKAAPKDKPYKLSDSLGLFLLVNPNGSRLWRMKYRFGGKEKLMAFGAYPEVSLAQARKARDIAREDLREGRDPSLVKKQLRAAAARTDNLLQIVGEAWIDSHGQRWSEIHRENVSSSLRTYVWPRLGRVALDNITPPMVLELLREIESKRAKETARRIRQRLSAIFCYAIASGIGTADPAAIVKGALPPLKKGNQPAIIKLDELRAMLRAVEEVPAHPVTMLGLRFLALTAVRPGELRATPWTEINGDLWVIPPERMKMRREHDVPLSRQAIETLEAVRQLTGNGPMIFPNARWAHRPMSENAMGYLLNRAGYAGRHVPHGFRAAFSSIMNERRPDDRAIIDIMLAHAMRNNVEAAYRRTWRGSPACIRNPAGRRSARDAPQCGPGRQHGTDSPPGAGRHRPGTRWRPGRRPRRCRASGYAPDRPIGRHAAGGASGVSGVSGTDPRHGRADPGRRRQRNRRTVR